MEAQPQTEELEQAAAHYRTAGNGLLLLGAINGVVGLCAIAMGSENAFIAYDMMVVFGLSFIVVGMYMRTHSDSD